MMIRMSDEDIKLSDSIEKWYAFDKNGIMYFVKMHHRKSARFTKC